MGGGFMGRRVISISFFTLTAAPVAMAQVSNDSAIVQLRRQLDEMRSQMAKMQDRIAELQAQVDAVTGSEVTNSSTHVIPRNCAELRALAADRRYSREHGRIEQGNQVVYMQRNLWSGIGGALQGSDVVAYTTLRLYLP
jgi:TolA-binding protein